MALPCLALSGWACAGSPPAGDKALDAVYDAQTGRLKQLKYDSNRNGKMDTVSFMDGVKVLRIEIDNDEDGRVDRWEYYTADQKLERVGFSRSNDGIEDAWSYAGSDGNVVRIDVSTRRDGRVTRVERYEGEQQSSAEEDTDGDGQMDKWETFDAGRLVSIAFDSAHKGRPDRRLVYNADGSVKVEVDPTGAGAWTAPER